MADRLPDVLDYGLRAVFCGTAAGRDSVRLGDYYAGAGNRFWETLRDVRLTPRRLRPAAFRAVLAFGLGLTDLYKTGSGMDRDIKDEPFDVERLRRSMLEFEPYALAFNGKKAAADYFGCHTRALDYGPQTDTIGRTRIYALPSTAPTARRYWDLNHWRALADVLLGQPSGSAGPLHR